jgi:hypothetical protein
MCDIYFYVERDTRAEEDDYSIRAYEAHVENVRPLLNNEFLKLKYGDNPICVNPAHLSIGTHKNNSDDMVRKGRHNITGSFGMLGKKQPQTIVGW